MSYYVALGSSELAAVWDACVAASLLSAYARPIWAGTAVARYEPVFESLGSARSKLEERIWSSLRIDRSDASIELYVPRYGGDVLSLWQCVVDARQQEAARALYGAFGRPRDVCYVALSVDDVPDFDDSVVDVDNFPWGAWYLIQARVRDGDGKWVERGGPALREPLR